MTEERKDEYKPDAKEEKKENSDSEETAILYESLSSEERKRLIADRLADAIQEIFPPPEVWKSMSHEEKINYLVKKDEGFLLPLAFAKAWIRGIQGIDLEDLEKIISLAKTTMTPQERERLKVFWDKKISYNDKPLIILDILDDMIGADYLGAVNMKVSETEEGELYLYFPPERILTNAKEILDLLILRGISSACKMREVIAVVMRVLKTGAERVWFSDIDPLDYLPLKNGSVLNLNTFEVTNERKYFTRSMKYSPSDQFLKDLQEGRVTEDRFKNEAWYKILRVCYTDEEWERLKLALGTILSGYNTDEKITLLIGEPRTRKTTLTSWLILSALGQFAVTGDLELITSKGSAGRFALQHAVGAKVMIMSEASRVVAKNIERLKRATGGDYVYIDVKGKSPREKLMSLAMLIASNEFPIIPDLEDEALLNRLILVETSNPHEWTEEEIKLREEVNIQTFLEFLIWCAYELKKRGWRVKDEEEKERIYEIIVESYGHVQSFFDDDCAFAQNYHIDGMELYEGYKEWCKKNRKKAVGRNTFYSLVERIGKEKGVRRSSKRPVVFSGIDLKMNADRRPELLG
jgi:hypothetical protein